MTFPTTLVILAAGKSTRFGAHKQLTPVGPGRQFLFDYNIYDAVQVGFEKVVLVTSAELEAELIGHSSDMEWDVPLAVAIQHSDGRPKPWGTGQAVLAAKDEVIGSFAVCNADDFYGRTSFELAHNHLVETAGSTLPAHANITYRLDSTLSPTGGVSRGVCQVVDGHVTEIDEVADLKWADGRVAGRAAGRSHAVYNGDEQVSMNLWAFDGRVVEILATQFADFREKTGDDPGEFYLSEALGEQVDRDQATLSCLPSADQWFGMTFAEDLPEVRHKIKELKGYDW